MILANARKQSQTRGAELELSYLGDLASGNVPERDTAVRRMVEMLPDPDRELIMLTVWERLSVAEAALTLGIRPGTARFRLHRARQRLAADPAIQALLQADVASPALAMNSQGDDEL